MWRSSGKSRAQQEIKAIYPRTLRIIIITTMIIQGGSDIIIGYVFVIKLKCRLSQRTLEAVTCYNIDVCVSAYFFNLASVLIVQSFGNRRVMFIQGLVVWIRMFDIKDGPYDNNANGSMCFLPAVARYKMTDSRQMPEATKTLDKELVIYSGI